MLLEKHDLREKVREKKVGNLILFVLDGSGSMIAEERMVATKGAILSLLLDAYQRRDHVGLIIFRGDGADDQDDKQTSFNRHFFSLACMWIAPNGVPDHRTGALL